MLCFDGTLRPKRNCVPSSVFTSGSGVATGGASGAACQRTSLTSALSGVTYIERSTAKGRVSRVGAEKRTSSAVRSRLISSTLATALPPRVKRRWIDSGLGTMRIEAMSTTGRPTCSTGPSRNEEP